MNRHAGSRLLIGYGNPGRLDDGLGPALAEALVTEWGEWSSRIQVESAYQLSIEHAELVSHFDEVIFVDATLEGQTPFQWIAVRPRASLLVSTHQVSPEIVLGLAHELFGASTVGHLLGIRGYAFDGFGEQLSSRALSNLQAATDWLQSHLRAEPEASTDQSTPILPLMEELP